VVIHSNSHYDLFPSSTDGETSAISGKPAITKRCQSSALQNGTMPGRSGISRADENAGLPYYHKMDTMFCIEFLDYLEHAKNTAAFLLNQRVLRRNIGNVCKMKIIRNTIIIIIILVVALIITRNMILKSATVKVVEQMTGFGMELDSFQAGLLKSDFEITGMKLLNPPDYPESTAFVMNRLYVKYDLFSLFTSEVHLYDVDIDIATVIACEKVNGEINIEQLASNARRASGDEPESTPATSTAPATEVATEATSETAPAEPQDTVADAPTAQPEHKDILIDQLSIKIDDVKYYRFKEGQLDPEIEERKLGIDETFTNVTNIDDIATQLSMRIMASEFTKEMRKYADENKEQLDKIGLKPSDVDKAGHFLQGMLKELKK